MASATMIVELKATWLFQPVIAYYKILAMLGCSIDEDVFLADVRRCFRYRVGRGKWRAIGG